MVLAIMIIGAIIFCRSLSFVVMQGGLRADRESWCLPRLVKQQKATDLAIVLYHLCVSLVGACLCVYSAWDIFSEKDVPLCVALILLAVLIVFFLIYMLVFFLTDRKYYVLHTFDGVVEYRKKQGIVTQDNDHEVNFIRGVKKVIKQRKFAIAWIVFLIGMMIFQIF